MTRRAVTVLFGLFALPGCLGVDTGPLQGYFAGDTRDETDDVLASLQAALTTNERLELAKTDWGELDDIWEKPIVTRALGIAAQAQGGPAFSCDATGPEVSADDCTAFTDRKTQALGGVEEVFFNAKGRDLPASCFYDADPDRCDAAVLTVLVNDPTRESNLLAKCDPEAASGGGACGDPCGLRNGFSYTCPPTPNCGFGCTDQAEAADWSTGGIGIPQDVLTNGGVWTEVVGTGTVIYDFDVATCKVTQYFNHDLCSSEPPTRIDLRAGTVSDAWIYCYQGGNSCAFCMEDRCTVGR